MRNDRCAKKNSVVCQEVKIENAEVYEILGKA